MKAKDQPIQQHLWFPVLFLCSTPLWIMVSTLQSVVVWYHFCQQELLLSISSSKLLSRFFKGRSSWRRPSSNCPPTLPDRMLRRSIRLAWTDTQICWDWNTESYQFCLSTWWIIMQRSGWDKAWYHSFEWSEKVGKHDEKTISQHMPAVHI